MRTAHRAVPLLVLLAVACSGAMDRRPVEPADTRTENERIADARESRFRQLTSDPGPESLAAEYARAQDAIHLLQRGRFADAERVAAEALTSDESNPYLHLVAGLADVSQGFIPLWKHYERFEIVFDLLEVAIEHPQLARMATRLGVANGGGEDIGLSQLAESAARIQRGFAEADVHLARAEAHADIQLLLCPAAWLVDWNDDGELDGADAMWEVSSGPLGEPIARDDYEARMPIFRHDVGDIAWLRAMVSFWTAITEVMRAYDWNALGEFVEGADEVEVRLLDADAMRRARSAILEGLAHSERSRLAFLAETDDQDEWLSNPSQQSHSFPVTLGQPGYEVWADAVTRLGQVFHGHEEVPLSPMVFVLSESAWTTTQPHALRVATLFEQPGDLLLRRAELLALKNRRVDDLAIVLTTAFGAGAVIDTTDDAGIFAPWVSAIEELDGGDRGDAMSARYLVRRRILYVN